LDSYSDCFAGLSHPTRLQVSRIARPFILFSVIREKMQNRGVIVRLLLNLDGILAIPVPVRLKATVESRDWSALSRAASFLNHERVAHFPLHLCDMRTLDEARSVLLECILEQPLIFEKEMLAPTGWSRFNW